MTDYVNVFVVGEVIRESVSQTRAAAVIACTDSQPRLEEQDRASQMTARLFRNGQSHHAMRVEFPARFLNPLARTTARGRGRVMCSTRTVHPPYTLAATKPSSFLSSQSAQQFLLGDALFTSLWRLSSTRVEMLYSSALFIRASAEPSAGRLARRFHNESS